MKKEAKKTQTENKTSNSLISFEKVTQISELTTPAIVQWSPNGKFIAVANYGSTNIIIYSFLNEKATKICEESGLTGPWGLAWSPDGKYIAVSNHNLDKMFIYKFTGNSINKLPSEAKGLTRPLLPAWSPDGNYIASNSMDNTVRLWDIRPYAPQERGLSIFFGHTHNFEKNLLRIAWSPDGRLISAGRADKFLYIWEVDTYKLVYKLPGHNGSINDVDFHPNEPISKFYMFFF